MELGGSFADIPFGPGTRIHVQEIEGLDMPEIRTNNQERALDHGLRMGRNLFGARTVTISFGLRGDDSDTLDDAAQACSEMYSKQDQEYPLVFDGGAKVIYCRAERFNLPRTFTDTTPQRFGFATMQFLATDPRIYSADPASDVIGLPIASTGASWPFSWPVTWGTTSGSGAIQVVNNGTFETPWLGQVDAGGTFVTGPRIENVTTGQTLDFTSLTLQPGQFLTLDAHERTAYLNGEASRYGSLSAGSRWFYLQPGLNEIRAGARTAEAGSAFTITWRDAWL